MKKILCIVISLLFLCSCSSKTSNILPVTKGICFDAQISYYNEAYECKVNIAKNGDTEIAFLSPETLLGLKVTYSGNQITADYNGIKYTYLAENLPQFSVSDTIYKIFSNTYDEISNKDDSYFVNYSNGDTEYKLYIGATGLPIKIESPYFIAEIKNATIK